MLQPTSMSWGARSVEWVRHKVPFGNWLADEGEHVYYTLNAPKKGGPQLKSLPPVGLSQPPVGSTQPPVGLSQPPTSRVRTANAPTHAAAWPPRIKPVFPHPLPGEGVWKPTGPPLGGGPPVLVTTFRPELDYPELVVYVAWFDHTRTTIAYYPGRYEPPNAAVRGPMMVPYDQRGRLLATFNGGFTYTDGDNGSADNGLTNEPLKDGNATLICYRDGHIAIVKWSGGPDVGPDVAWARQSLAPIVWNGQLNPQLNDNPNSPQWGYTLGGVTRVWRTGAGIDRRGNLIYVASDDQTVITLARILQHVGAVRAMEFDINPYWHTLITYTHGAKGLVPTMVGPNAAQPPTRYLVPDDRDFFAVYRPLPAPVTVPFK
ncbi:MAG TPA: phosphodiester glycosidase family protein [Acidimicrobiales bacterium]|nr:phosphodiester glycosidase family protein [Acidimicrobiales bacterium]